jgi:hypothetical protein
MPVAELGSVIHPYPTHGFGLQDLASRISTERFTKSCTGRYLGAKDRTPLSGAGGAGGNDL